MESKSFKYVPNTPSSDQKTSSTIAKNEIKFKNSASPYFAVKSDTNYAELYDLLFPGFKVFTNKFSAL
jgi:hypothetical protein